MSGHTLVRPSDRLPGYRAACPEKGLAQPGGRADQRPELAQGSAARSAATMARVEGERLSV
jgi:hypothetical protein